MNSAASQNLVRGLSLALAGEARSHPFLLIEACPFALQSALQS